MPDVVDLSPPRFAALVAPPIDRVFRAAMRAAREAGGAELSRRYGGPAGTGFLIDFRTRLAAAGATVSAEGFAAVTRYRDPGECQRALDKQVAHGMVERDPDGGFRATERGRTFLGEIYALHATVTAALWETEHAVPVGRLADLAGRALAEAGKTGGPAFGAMAPPYEPAHATPGTLLLNRLGTLRYHRADAHANAWLAAGQTARSIADMPPGPARAAIEAETDRGAAEPYTVLTADERLTLLADLAALPG